MRAAGRIEVIRRPGYMVTIGRSFRALTAEPTAATTTATR
jgi:hypothetical protein